MSKKTSALLLMMLLAVMASTVITSAGSHDKETTKIEFKAFVSGECYMSHGSFFGPSDWYGIGRGSTSISGFAKAVPLDENAVPEEIWPLFDWLVGTTLGDVYISEHIRAWGFVSLGWEEDGTEHQLLVVLYSTVSPWAGIFAPDTNYFVIPLGGWYDPEPLRFRGIHISGSEIQIISGLALFEVWPFSFGPYIPGPIDRSMVMLWLMDDVQEKLYCSIWISTETWIHPALHLNPVDQEDPPEEAISVPAREVFKSSVEIISSP